jgi:hypothetical protein
MLDHFSGPRAIAGPAGDICDSGHAGFVVFGHDRLPLPSKPFAEDSYFEIERASLERRPHQTCGGRSLNENVMDTIYTLLVNTGNGARISDGVDRATVPASEDFPYMAPPNPGGPQLGEFAKLVRPQAEAPKGRRP